MIEWTDIPPSIDTPRLIGRRLQDADIGAVYRQFADPGMCEYFSDPPCSLPEARGIIRHYQQPVARFWRYALFTRESQQFIGTCGYHFYDASHQQVEIGYDIWRAYWRQGYARESVAVLTDLCFTQLAVRTVYAFIHHHNTASQAVVKRLGFVPSTPLRTGMSEDETCWALVRS